MVLAFKVLLMMLVVAVVMAVLDIWFDITDRDTKRNEVYAYVGGWLVVADLAGWVIYLLFYIALWE